MIVRSRNHGLATFAAALALAFTTAFAVPSMANTAVTPHHKKNIIQRHPTMTGVAAGVATRHALKVSAARKKARHQKLNWAERHPTMTGFGAGMATRHVIKTHTAK